MHCNPRNFHFTFLLYVQLRASFFLQYPVAPTLCSSLWGGDAASPRVRTSDIWFTVPSLYKFRRQGFLIRELLHISPLTAKRCRPFAKCLLMTTKVLLANASPKGFQRAIDSRPPPNKNCVSRTRIRTLDIRLALPTLPVEPLSPSDMTTAIVVMI